MADPFSAEADMSLVGQNGLELLFPGNTCQSPPSIMYSLPLHHQQIALRPQSTQPVYAQTHDHQRMVSSPYPHQAFWSNQSSTMLQSYIPVPSYPSLPQIGALHFMASGSALHSHRLNVTRSSRSHSASSMASSSGGVGISSDMINIRPQLSRSLSPSSPDLRAYGFLNSNGTWSCAYPSCTSRAMFTRGCDLRKHHKRHTKPFFCRHEGCPQSMGGGFSSKKDLARHEAKHNPGVLCDWDGCGRVFSRVDNMRDHIKRIHLKPSRGHGSKAPS